MLPASTLNAAGMERQLTSDSFQRRLSAAHILAEREDIHVAERAPMLIAALEAEVTTPFDNAPPVRDAYLAPGEVLRLALVRSMAALGDEALPIAQEAAGQAEGTAANKAIARSCRMTWCSSPWRRRSTSA